MTPPRQLRRMLEVPTERTLRQRFARQPAGFVSLAVGLLAVIVACAVQLGEDPLFSVHPDPRVTLPFFALAAAATVISLVRRERAYAVAVGGLALATSALALGWVLALAIVAAVAGILIYVLSELM